jgi:sterol desaturase/sphingolipid hydroxylase (fatty acid hydroxylase superfamily)
MSRLAADPAGPPIPPEASNSVEDDCRKSKESRAATGRTWRHRSRSREELLERVAPMDSWADTRWTSLLAFLAEHGLPSARAQFVALVSLAQLAAFFGSVLLFELVVPRLPGAQRWKLEHGPPPPSAELVHKATRKALATHLVTNPALVWLVYPLVVERCGVSVDGPLPSLGTALVQLLVCMAVEDTLFYWLHRLLHHRLLYRHLHKQHHEFKSNVGWAGAWFNPAEEAINVLPFAVGPLAQGVHLAVLLAWVVVRINELVDAHSGYECPFSPWELLSFQGGADRHEFHHSHNVGSFGSFFNVWDRLMGTDKAFLEFKRKRERLRREGTALQDPSKDGKHA